jgi:hypothetical protein
MEVDAFIKKMDSDYTININFFNKKIDNDKIYFQNEDIDGYIKFVNVKFDISSQLMMPTQSMMSTQSISSSSTELTLPISLVQRQPQPQLIENKIIEILMTSFIFCKIKIIVENMGTGYDGDIVILRGAGEGLNLERMEVHKNTPENLCNIFKNEINHLSIKIKNIIPIRHKFNKFLETLKTYCTNNNIISEKHKNNKQLLIQIFNCLINDHLEIGTNEPNETS